MRPLSLLALLPALALPAASAPSADEKVPAWYAKAVQKVEATFEPAEARPGQTVTLKVAVHLNPGYVTYPTRQADKGAAGMVNSIKFPNPGAVVFVGDVADPKDAKTKAEPELGIKEIRYYADAVVYERKAVVSPAAKPGAVTVTLPAFKLTVCDAANCYPARSLTPAATLKVLDGPPVPVDPAFADEVKKAAGGM